MSETVLYTSEQIQETVRHISNLINLKFKNTNKPVLLVGVLTGAYMFLTDISKYITIPCEIEFVKLSSYVHNQRTDNIKVDYCNLSKYNLDEYNVIIVDDVYESGNTIKFLKNYIRKTYNTKTTLYVCVLVYKSFKDKIRFLPDFTGFLLTKNHFLVGYGMDDNNKCRNIPYVYYKEDK